MAGVGLLTTAPILYREKNAKPAKLPLLVTGSFINKENGTKERFPLK